jgi:SAM-dependent methyltransferase
LAEDVVRFCKVEEPSVLDIACNDGTLMEAFRFQTDGDIIGIDPATNIVEAAQNRGLCVLWGYWKKGVAQAFPKKIDIITATNVFAHVDEPGEFLVEAEEVLSDDGVLVIEFPYCNQMIQNREFDTIYHEHLSYFTVCSFGALLTRYTPRLTISKIVQTPIHGGSIRFYLTKSGELHTDQTFELIDKEKALGLLRPNTYFEFAEACLANLYHAKNIVRRMKDNGKKVVGFGASAKGNTMLNAAGLTHEDIDYIVDDTPIKIGKRTPGSNIPVVPITQLINEQDEVIVLMLAWNFKEEIKKRIRHQCHPTHLLLFYVPEVSMEY